MNKIEAALTILSDLGLPKKQQNERSALILLALANLKKTSKWVEAKQVSMSIVGNKVGTGKYPGIMNFINKNYSSVRTYKENSRESFRDETIKPFIHACICEQNPEEPGLASNSMNNHYRLSTEVLTVIRSFGTKVYEQNLIGFKSKIGTLTEKYAKARNILKIPIKIAQGIERKLSPGKHNELQAAILHNFAAIFAQGSEVVYFGDTEVRDSYVNKNLLEKLKIPINVHSKLPDIILYDIKKDWVFLIEAFTSVGPMSPQRVHDLEKLLSNCKSGKIYITAFPDHITFKKHMSEIAWETEVWIADNPTHMIHFNGDKFLGPR